MTRIILFIVLLNIALFAQSENERWIKIEQNYEMKLPEGKNYRIDNSSFSSLLVSSAQSAYYFLFSEYDGDNCPFHPSCSNFFVKSVKETNILKGSLMFADRFTRDMNFFKGLNHYPIDYTGKFYDPPSNYTLNEERIIITPNKHIDEN